MRGVDFIYVGMNGEDTFMYKDASGRAVQGRMFRTSDMLGIANLIEPVRFSGVAPRNKTTIMEE